METMKRPVVADPDTAFLQKIFYECGECATPPLVVNSTEKLRDILQREAHSVSGIFLNPRLICPQSAAVMKSIREHLPNTPLFYILDESVNQPDAADLRELTVADCLKKPFCHADIEKALTHSLMRFDSKSALDLAENDPLQQDIAEADENFCPIWAKNFLAGKESFFDLYIRIKANHFVKVLQAGDLFSRDRLDQYLQKGVEQFFIRRKVQEKYLDYCDKVTDALLASPKVTIDVQATHVMNMGEETSKFLRTTGVQESTINFARHFAKKSLDLSMRLTQDESILKHLYDAANFDHSVSVTMVSSLLATHLNFDHDRATSIVGLSAMLHDVGMVHIAKELHGVDPADLTCEDLDIYEAHPTIGQEMLKKIPGLEPVVIQAVGQHHERRNGKGFPNKLRSGSINVVAEIIGISEEFIQLLVRAKKDPSLPVMKKMEKRLDGFSHSTVTSFRYFFGKCS